MIIFFKISKNGFKMATKLFSIVLVFCCIGAGCQSKSSPNAPNNAQNATDSVVLTKSVGDNAVSVCAEVLNKPSEDAENPNYTDSLQLGNKHLYFLTRDSTFYVYQQTANQCTLIFETHIDIEDNSWLNGVKIKLEDVDGDNQKELFVRIFREKNYYKYWVFRILEEKDKVVFKKINRFEELLNVKFDKQSGLIRSNWGQKGLEIDEFYKLSKGDVLTFVKGTRSVTKGDDVKDTEYTTKEGW
jgi:hypothetical protein